MAYDFEKYRTKREKVLGVRKRGLGFGTLATLVAAVILLGLGAVAIPKTVSYFSTKNLDDAIYKLADGGAWNQAVVDGIASLEGVRQVVTDNNHTRLVVTFDRHHGGPDVFQAFFNRKKVAAEMLNRMGHRERKTILEKEAAFEAS